MAAQDRIAQLLATWEPALKAAFLEAVDGIRSRVRLSELVKALERGDVEQALQLVGIDPPALRPFESALERAFEGSGQDITQAIARMRRANDPRPLFDYRQPGAEGWVRSHAEILIRDVVADQTVMVRQNLEAGLILGQSPQTTALNLVGRINRATGKREGGYIGLTASQETWARNYEAELAGSPPDAAALTRKLRDRRFDRTVAKAIREGKPIPAETRQAMAAAYRNRALMFRAGRIAEVEAHLALQEAQDEAWRQAIARGAVQEQDVRRYWLTVGDDRVRPTHRAVPGMNKAGVGLREPFQTPKGPAMQPGWSFDPGCRCRTLIRIVEAQNPGAIPRQPAFA